jgi:hypothetical protein
LTKDVRDIDFLPIDCIYTRVGVLVRNFTCVKVSIKRFAFNWVKNARRRAAVKENLRANKILRRRVPNIALKDDRLYSIFDKQRSANGATNNKPFLCVRMDNREGDIKGSGVRVGVFKPKGVYFSSPDRLDYKTDFAIFLGFHLLEPD